ncbi:hypothetical protein RvY_03376 [Ramazzottius varieornatus]|uniref:Uncharacterized protein n=1 Tax=Ramazzottius varieornatus TaxID=947166 RepID=A0A1D1UUW5_RAMVA|nr:hypothetical protein RvY_03376 [Ramazzottius varieornatus]
MTTEIKTHHVHEEVHSANDGQRKDPGVFGKNEYKKPTIKFQGKSTYQASFFEKPLENNRQGRPQYKYVLPEEKLQQSSTYEADFPPHEVERVPAIRPKQEYIPPHDFSEMESSCNAAYTQKPIDVERKGRQFKAFAPPTDKMQGVSTNKSDFPAYDRVQKAKPNIPQSEQLPLKGHMEGESVTRSQFTPKPMTMDRRQAPFKHYSRPVERMDGQSSYKEDFVKQEVSKPAAIRHVEEFHMPHDHPTVLRSEAHEQFDEKCLEVERKHRPHMVYHLPEDKMAQSSTYSDQFGAKDGKKAAPFLPHQEYQPPHDFNEMQTEQQAKYTVKPIEVGRKGAPLRPYAVPTIKMDTDTEYHSGFNATRTAMEASPAQKVLPRANSWFKMEKDDSEVLHTGTEYRHEYRPNDAEQLKAVHREMNTYVDHGVYERPHSKAIRRKDTDWTYMMSAQPSSSSLDEKLSRSTL